MGRMRSPWREWKDEEVVGEGGVYIVPGEPRQAKLCHSAIHHARPPPQHPSLQSVTRSSVNRSHYNHLQPDSYSFR